MSRLRIAHMVNPVKVGPPSDLYRAQPVTFESLRVAREMASEHLDVELLSAQFMEDRDIVPPWIRTTRDLDRSVQELGTFRTDRKLPVLRDIVDRLVETASGADLLIYTNVDIAVLPHFYLSVAQLFDDGIDAFVINRRTIPDDYEDPEDLPRMYAEVGRPHPGRDCFVFTPSAACQYHLGDAIIGADWVGQILMWNLVSFSERFAWYTDLHLTFHLGNERRWSDPRFDEYGDYNRRVAVRVLEALEDRFGDLTRVAGDGQLFWRWFLRSEFLARARRSLRRASARIRWR